MRQMRTDHRNETFYPVRTGPSTRRGPKRHGHNRDLRYLWHSYSRVTIGGSFPFDCPILFLAAVESAFPDFSRTVFHSFNHTCFAHQYSRRRQFCHQYTGARSKAITRKDRVGSGRAARSLYDPPHRVEYCPRR